MSVFKLLMCEVLVINLRVEFQSLPWWLFFKISNFLLKF